ncbi:hypothetical protein GTS_54710 [Gandjariella thermophila]|uniref:ADP-ribosylglycohydrolase n=1 Tax=Gandjariella thermophila TaxID=1931992 RepID=A0A4D4JGS8_9PSEU|nr:hypothetical protein GTS_54710 [Gandjariella thermophila]
MEHDELVSKHSVPGKQVPPEVRKQREETRARLRELKKQGKYVSPEMADRTKFPIGLDDNYEPYPLHQKTENASGDGGRGEGHIHRIAPTRKERFVGSILAGAVGDALGYTVEFESIDGIRGRYGDAGITDFDRRGGRGGEISDDTQMTLFTLEGLIRAHVRRRLTGSDDVLLAVQHAYQRWLHTQGNQWANAAGMFGAHAPAPDGWLISNPGLFATRAPGNTCITALRTFARTGQMGTFTHHLNDSKGCGGVMRAAPAALWSDDAAEVFHFGAATAALTHSHPSGYLSAGTLAVIVHQLLAGADLRAAIATAHSILLRWDGHEEQARALDAAIDLASAGRPTPEQIAERLGGGWVGEEALAIGVCAALCTDNLTDALIVAVNHSGDSDSTGAVCGNIVGAHYGPAAIPESWLATLELRDVIETITRDAVREFGPEPPSTPDWDQRYPGW